MHFMAFLNTTVPGSNPYRTAVANQEQWQYLSQSFLKTAVGFDTKVIFYWKATHTKDLAMVLTSKFVRQVISAEESERGSSDHVWMSTATVSCRLQFSKDVAASHFHHPPQFPQEISCGTFWPVLDLCSTRDREPRMYSGRHIPRA